MRLNEMTFSDARPIDGYGPGFFRVGGEIFKGGILMLPAGTRRWDGYEITGSIVDMADSIDVIFVGTGAVTEIVPAGFRNVLESAGLGVEAMATPAACRTYNVLLSEGRRIAAALLPV